MKKTTIERMYTQRVTALLNQGWHINAGTMSGSQGEIAHIDLASPDGSEIRRVLLQREYPRGRRYSGQCGEYYGDVISIIVGRNTDPILPGWTDSTLWNNHMEVLEHISFAEISDPRRRRRNPEGWYTDMETAKEIQRVRYERRLRADRPVYDYLGEASKSITLGYVRKQPRMKTTRLEDIKVYKRCDLPGRYYIEARGKVYELKARNR